MKKGVYCVMMLALLLSACAAPSAERMQISALYEKYHAHCLEHATKNVASPDEERLYNECMEYFVGTDVHCPYCVVDPHMHR